MSSPLLKPKNSTMTILESVAFLKEHFDNLGYGGKTKFIRANKKIKYSTLNAIINYNPNSKKNAPLSIKKIPEIFKAIGYNCEIVKTVEFHVSEKQ